MFVRVTRDRKSSKLRVYLNDAEVSESISVKTRVPGRDRSSAGVTSHCSAQLSSVMKNKMRTATNGDSQPLQLVCVYNCTVSHKKTIGLFRIIFHPCQTVMILKFYH